MRRPSSVLVSETLGLANYLVGDAIHLADSILGDREPLTGAEHDRPVVEIIEKVYESARLGRRRDLHTTFPGY